MFAAIVGYYRHGMKISLVIFNSPICNGVNMDFEVTSGFPELWSSNAAALQSSFFAAMCKAGRRTLPLTSFSSKIATTLSCPCCILHISEEYRTKCFHSSLCKYVTFTCIISFFGGIFYKLLLQSTLNSIYSKSSWAKNASKNFIGITYATARGVNKSSVANDWFAPLARRNLTIPSWFSWLQWILDMTIMTVKI